MKITLVSYTKDPEITCAKCASVSWRRKGMKEISLDEARRIIKDVLEYGQVAPSLFEDSGPSCVVLGYCPEGKLTCGKLNQILKIYRSR